MITDPLFYLLAVVAVTLLGLSKGGFFGLGVMGLPLLSLYVPPLQAAAIILPTVLAQDVLTIWAYRRDWSAWNLKVMIPSMIVGMAIGTLFAASLSAAHIRLAIGIIAALFVAAPLARPALRAAGAGARRRLGRAVRRDRRLHDAPGQCRRPGLADASSRRRSSTSSPTRARSPCCSRRATSIKVPAYGALGQLTAENLAVGAVLLPAAIAANYAGIWMVRRISGELFFRIAYVLMLFIAIALIRSALTELWA